MKHYYPPNSKLTQTQSYPSLRAEHYHPSLRAHAHAPTRYAPRDLTGLERRLFWRGFEHLRVVRCSGARCTLMEHSRVQRTVHSRVPQTTQTVTQAYSSSLARLSYHSLAFPIIDEYTSAVSSDVEGKIYEREKALGISLITISLLLINSYRRWNGELDI